MRPLELYIHIPFCVRKCKYCDFLSGPSTLAERQAYVQSLCQKIRAQRELAKAYCVTSVFIGGGTPSLLEIDLLEEIFAALRETFLFGPVTDEAETGAPNAPGSAWPVQPEITLEANPGTVTAEKLDVYRRLGINRLSIGAQSADDKELMTLGRIHKYSDFQETYRLAREAGFTNINVDLMSGIPGQTIESWHQTLHAVADLGPEHISAYSLIIEEGTLFYDLYGPDAPASRRAGGLTETSTEEVPVPQLPDEDTERQMYYDTKEILEKYGYHRYEISNYAKPGYECRHNLGYWERAEYLGFGAGAASLLDNKRWVEGEEPETLSQQDQMSEFMFLGLRKMQGVSRKAFQQTFGQSMDSVYGAVIADMENKELLEEADGYVRLTDRGIDISNYVMSEFV